MRGKRQYEEAVIAETNWRRRALLAFVVLSIALAVAAYRWRGAAFEWRKFGATLVHVDWLWMTLALLLALSTYAGRALRWEVMLRPVCAKTSFSNIFSATAIGFTAVVLFGRPGELVRPYLIAIKEKVSFSSQVAAWFLERFYDLFVVLLLFGFALTRVAGSGIHSSPRVQGILQIGGYVVATGCLLCLAILVLVRRFSVRLEQRLVEALAFLKPRHMERVRQVLASFQKAAESTRSPGFMFTLLFYTLVEWVLIYGCYVCLFRSFPSTAGFSFIEVVVFIGFVSLGSVVQLPGIGGGVQVAAIFVLTELMGLTLEVASGIAVLIWVTTFVVIVPVGLYLAFHEGLNWKKLKEIEEKAAAL